MKCVFTKNFSECVLFFCIRRCALEERWSSESQTKANHKLVTVSFKPCDAQQLQEAFPDLHLRRRPDEIKEALELKIGDPVIL